MKRTRKRQRKRKTIKRKRKRKRKTIKRKRK